MSPSGPLAGVTIIELAGMGALPFGTGKLGDMGADVIRVHRTSEVPASPQPARYSEYNRGRRSIAVDLKQPEGVEVVRRLAETADAFAESFRPGVAERLGVGPDDLWVRNPKLVYARLTGWGQDGPLAMAAGHSLNYEGLTGAIGSIGSPHGPPIPLLQVLGDFAGGGLHLAFGVVCALWEAQRSGKGQVIDVAMLDGVASLYSVFYGMASSGMHTEDIGTNFFDGGSPAYNVYETSDGKFVTVAPIEPQFWALLLEKLGIEPASAPNRDDPAEWEAMKSRLAEVFLTRTRSEWQDLLEGTDACFSPVYRFGEVHEHPHNVARGLFRQTPDGGRELTPSPRFSRTPGEPQSSYTHPGSNTDEVLAQAGYGPTDITKLRKSGAVG
jgi:alpha-methylacyl-CoA racemase